MKKKRIRMKKITTYPVKKGVSVFVFLPFGIKEKLNNILYFALLNCLEEGSNRLVYKNMDGDIVPMQLIDFGILLGKDHRNYTYLVAKLIWKRILLPVEHPDFTEFFFNPNYAFYGEEIPVFLIDLFKPKKLGRFTEIQIKIQKKQLFPTEKQYIYLSDKSVAIKRGVKKKKERLQANPLPLYEIRKKIDEGGLKYGE